VNLCQATNKKRKISYLEQHTFSHDALCMQHKLPPPGTILISVISSPLSNYIAIPVANAKSQCLGRD